MPVYHPPKINSSEITPRSAYLSRRSLLAGAAAAGFATTMPLSRARAAFTTTPSKYSIAETPTGREDITTYNNFYEFGTGKDDPAANAHTLTTIPWTVEVGGLVAKPQKFGVEDLLKSVTLEDRIYRMRCVEGWSMVIPWVGFPLSEILNRVEPQGDAKYVAFETLVRPEEMPGQGGYFPVLEWPYVEGLRLDEAMHPLTIMAVGLYGDAMPNQNGAPIRLVVPWKYGFKGIKSIVKISLVDRQPETSWNKQASNEYGFYSNVNPEVDHPRWSQATERPIGGGLFGGRKPTVMFNGYGDEVASLYAGMDLRANF